MRLQGNPTIGPIVTAAPSAVPAARPRTRRRVARGLLTLLLGLAAIHPTISSAQGTQAADTIARGGTILGTVIDPTGKPLAGVEVHFTGAGRSTRTDDAGRWRFDDPPAGPRVLSARLVGWTPVTATVNVAAGRLDTLPLVMRRFPNTLSTVEVTARSRAADWDAERLAERLMQMRAGTGRLYTRDDILRAQATSIADLVRGVPGVNVRTGKNGSIIATSARGGVGAMQVQGQGCPLQFYLDGRAVDNEVVAALSPLQFASVEVHPNTAIFTGMPTFPGKCGAVIVRMFWR